MNKTDVRKNYLYRLASAVCEDFQVTPGSFYSRHSRGYTSRARHVFVLVALDSGFTPGEIESQLHMHQTFVSQVLRRNYALRDTVEYKHAHGLMHGWLNHAQDLKESVA